MHHRCQGCVLSMREMNTQAATVGGPGASPPRGGRGTFCTMYILHKNYNSKSKILKDHLYIFRNIIL
jgi:hypothetical protein